MTRELQRAIKAATQDLERVSPAGRALGGRVAAMAEAGERIIVAALGDRPMPREIRIRSSMCPTCACRPGTVPNGCAQTQMDLLKAASEGGSFACHSPLDGTLCRGWAAVRAFVVRHPLPRRMRRALQRHTYSPPDET